MTAGAAGSRGCLVAIHQPNFLPWLGTFDKLFRADRFVTLDVAQFPKKGGNWCNRVRILLGGEPAWLTMPVDRAHHGVRSLREMRIADVPWRDKRLGTLRSAYGRAPAFDEVYPVLEAILRHPVDRVADFNHFGLRTLASKLGLDPARIVAASTLAPRGRATERLVEIVEAVGGNAYLCGGGAAAYQEDRRFAEAGIDLVWQRFRHPVYAQRGARRFHSGLSIVDALMSCGFAGTRALLRDSAGASRAAGDRAPDPPREDGAR